MPFALCMFHSWTMTALLNRRGYFREFGAMTVWTMFNGHDAPYGEPYRNVPVYLEWSSWRPDYMPHFIAREWVR